MTVLLLVLALLAGALLLDVAADVLRARLRRRYETESAAAAHRQLMSEIRRHTDE